MNKNGFKNLIKSLFEKKLPGIGFSLVRLYDRSLTSAFIKGTRLKLLSLQAKVMGLFFLTAGIYSFLIAVFTAMFTKDIPHASSLYGGALCALAALPLMFSKGNLSTLLSESAVGGAICDYLNIHREGFVKNSFSGSPGLAFIGGVAVGALTLFVPFGTILKVMAVAFIFATVISSPETGLSFMTVLFFFSSARLQLALLAVTALAYTLKLVRKKRRLNTKKADISLLIFALCSLGALIFTRESALSEDYLIGFFFIFAYFACVCLMRDSARLLKLYTLAIILCGVLCALYITAFSLDAILPKGIGTDRDYLLGFVSSLPAFSGDFAAVSMTAFIPGAAALMIKTKNDGYRLTFCLCLVAMTVCLALTGNISFLVVAVAVSAFLLIITGSKRVYVALCASLCALVSLLFAGELGNRLYRYAFRQLLASYNQAKLLFGQGPEGADVSFAGDGFTNVGSSAGFFNSIVSHMGVCGAFIFAFFIGLVLYEAVTLYARTLRVKSFSEASLRYSGTNSLSEMRICMLAFSASLISLLISSAFCDLYKSPLSLMLLFILCGAVVSYARASKEEIARAVGSLNTENYEDSCNAVVCVSMKKG